MKSSPSRAVLADTCFWIALYDPRDGRHTVAVSILEAITGGTLLFPWPLYYELLRTRFVKQPGWVERFLTLVKSGRLLPIDDTPYREKALESTLDLAARGQRSISLVDMVIRHILDDRDVRIIELITFNIGDFRDVCDSRGIRIRSTVH